MADDKSTTPAKQEGGTKDASGTSDNALAKLSGSKPIPPGKIGRSLQELSAGDYPHDEKAFDSEQQPIAPEAQGAIGYADSLQESFNAPYIGGGGIYSRAVRNG